MQADALLSRDAVKRNGLSRGGILLKSHCPSGGTRQRESRAVPWCSPVVFSRGVPRNCSLLTLAVGLVLTVAVFAGVGLYSYQTSPAQSDSNGVVASSAISHAVQHSAIMSVSEVKFRCHLQTNRSHTHVRDQPRS